MFDINFQQGIKCLEKHVRCWITRKIKITNLGKTYLWPILNIKDSISIKFYHTNRQHKFTNIIIHKKIPWLDRKTDSCQ